MLDSAKEAIEFATGKSRSDLDDDRKLVLAIIKSIEIIGEATKQAKGGSFDAVILDLHLPDSEGLDTYLRMQEAEKKAAALPPKLTVPMIGFFLPVLFAVIMGPAALQVMALD